jgi:hypothetical protein
MDNVDAGFSQWKKRFSEHEELKKRINANDCLLQERFNALEKGFKGLRKEENGLKDTGSCDELKNDQINCINRRLHHGFIALEQLLGDSKDIYYDLHTEQIDFIKSISKTTDRLNSFTRNVTRCMELKRKRVEGLNGKLNPENEGVIVLKDLEPSEDLALFPAVSICDGNDAPKGKKRKRETLLLASKENAGNYHN